MIDFYCVTNYFCNEDITKIENYEQAMNDTTQTWHCHHRFETDLNLSKQELIDRDLYYHRPANELIFLTKSEHMRLHGKNKTEKTKKKLSESLTGRSLPEQTRQKMSKSRKRRIISEETKQKIKETLTGRHHSEETKKKLSEAMKGRRWKLINGKHVYY